MAYYCRTCRLVFERKYSNCHLCGYGLESDDKPVQEYIDMGYEAVDKEKPTTLRFRVDDSDILSALRNGYSNEYNRSDSPAPQPKNEFKQEAPSSTDLDFFARPAGKNTSEQETVLVPSSTNSDSDDFFAQQTGPASQAVRSAATEVPPIPPTHVPRRSNFSLGNLWYRFLNVIYRIPWGVICRIVLIVLLIGGLVTLWNARFSILDSILSFLVSLLPSVLIIGGIIYLIRKLLQ